MSTLVFLRDAANGLLEISHNTLALVGLSVLAALLFAAGRQEVRDQAEQAMLQWLQLRQEARVQGTPEAAALQADSDAGQRATAVDPGELTREQATVAKWIARKYRVAQEPVGRLVQEAWSVGTRVGIDPTLILAVMAVESSFNPFAQSPVGAQGLMQVMTRVHDNKYEPFGGARAAFDPVSNLRVGVQVLKECIVRAGNLNDGLRFYVGASAQEEDGGYAGRVLAEQARLRDVARGKNVPVSAATVAAAVPMAASANSIDHAPQGDVAEPDGVHRAGDAAADEGSSRPKPQRVAMLR